MIERVWYENFRGQTASHTLAARTLIIGPNGAGKTTVGMAIDLAWFGRLPQDDSHKAADVFRHATVGTDHMAVGIKFEDGFTIERRWGCSAGRVSQRVVVNGRAMGANDAKIAIAGRMQGRAPLVDVDAFLALSARKQQLWIMDRCGIEGGDALLAEEERAREAVNRVKRDIEAKRKSITDLARTIAGLESTPGDPEMLSGQIERDELELRGILDRLAKADMVLAERQRLLSMVKEDVAEEQLTATEQKCETARQLLLARERDLETARKARDEWLADEGKSWQGEINYEFCANTTALLRTVLDDLQMAAGDSEPAILAARQKIKILIDRAGYMKERAEMRGAALRAEGDCSEARIAYDQAAATYSTMSDTRVKAIDARKRLDELETIDKAEDALAAEGLRARIDEMKSRFKGMQERHVLEKRAEDLRLEMEGLEAVCEERKKELEDALASVNEPVDRFVVDAESRGLSVWPAAVMLSESGSIGVGKRLGDHRVGFNQLSGAERVYAKAALGAALGGETCTLFLDAGEMSRETLSSACANIRDSHIEQIIIATWVRAHTDWDVISLEKGVRNEGRRESQDARDHGSADYQVAG